MVISEGHKGIQKAVREGFPRASWQMCLVHYLRAIMRYVPERVRKDYIPFLKAAIFENEDDIMSIAEDLYYNGYLKAANTIERFLPDIHKRV